MTMHWLRRRLWMALAIGLAACGAVDPYVYKPDEFNRNSPTFNKQPADRDEATICYNGVGTSDATVAGLAEQECAKFGKTARLEGETFGNCPLLTPVEARFACVRTDAE
jgi:hypothetical protein